MHEAFFFCYFKAEGLFFHLMHVQMFMMIACSDIQTTKYSGGQESCVKMILKNAGAGWQGFFYLFFYRWRGKCLITFC